MYELTLQINGRLQPLDRGDMYEDPINEALQKCGCGCTDGGGTLMEANGEIENCDVEISLEENSQDYIQQLLQIIDEIGVPKGSILHGDEFEQAVGRLEGLALYLNGVELPDEVYQTCDINFVVSELDRLLEGKGVYYSHWRGEKETALYFYGTSFIAMQQRIASFVGEYPLCQQSRVVQIA